MIQRAIYWFRRDCRLEDNPLLHQALTECREVLPVYIENSRFQDHTEWGFVRQAEHNRAFKSHILAHLRTQLERQGSVLWQTNGDPVVCLVEWCREFGIQRIYAETIAAEEEEQEIRALVKQGIEVITVFQSTMIDKALVKQVLSYFPMSFTRFRQKIEAQNVRFTAPQHNQLPPLHVADEWRNSEFAQNTLSSTQAYSIDPRTSLPVHNGLWLTDYKKITTYITEDYFKGGYASSYKATRNQLQGIHYSSKWSVWLAHGILSARTLMVYVDEFENQSGANESTYWLWFELLWRDYFRFLFYQRKTNLFLFQGLTVNSQVQPPAFNQQQFFAWSHGQTGVDLIDAAMRELYHTGYLSNRLRQVVASFWLNEYQGDWRVGASWFESQLIDYDVYSNYGNWLYIAGKGTDPRGGRHFNIQKQTDEYDPDGRYRQTWLR
ncbi:DASH family cryptochrome [Ferrovum sp. PN-J185]|uniref:DASH family cryptochrome n=1 Tax=Ferrovum sp. PN-J185 TaxID=1356306 RepID=UPI001E2F77F7|nr:DASH family cryptochrome [Ferrovum sp. PN-J185]MCC6068128.1 DASH family cryptochrome [Ferrovum sp. PN-J185]